MLPPRPLQGGGKDTRKRQLPPRVVITGKWLRGAGGEVTLILCDVMGLQGCGPRVGGRVRWRDPRREKMETEGRRPGTEV